MRGSEDISDNDRMIKLMSPEMARLMQARRPARLDLPIYHVNTTVPMNPKEAQRTPIEDNILVVSNQLLVVSGMKGNMKHIW